MRSTPPRIFPVRYKDIRLEAKEGSINGTIAAYQGRSSGLLWEKEIYRYRINPNIEPDTQWTFISCIYLKDDSLIIINERGDKFALDLKSLTVNKINISKYYSDISKFEKSIKFDEDKEWRETSLLIKKCTEHFTTSGSKCLSLELFDEIINWKLGKQRNRTEHYREIIDEEMVNKITSCSFSFYHPNPETEVLTRLRILQALPGIGLGVASAILTICFPEDYAIIDYRVWKVIYNEEKKTFTYSDYLKYYFDIWSCAQKLGMEMQKIDFLTWKYWEYLKDS